MIAATVCVGDRRQLLAQRPATASSSCSASGAAGRGAGHIETINLFPPNKCDLTIHARTVRTLPLRPDTTGCMTHRSVARPGRAPRSLLRDRLLRLAERATTPLLPADYLDLFDPLRSGADLRGRIVAVQPETARRRHHRDPARRGLGRPRARPVRPDRHRRRRRPPVARLLADPRPPRRRPHLASPSRRSRTARSATTSSTAPRPGTLVHLEQAAGEFVLPDADGRQAAVRHRRLRHHPGDRACCATCSRSPTPAWSACRAARTTTSSSCTSRPASPTRSSSTTCARSTTAGLIRLVARYDDEHGMLDVADLDRPGARPARAHDVRLRPGRPARRPRGAPRPSAASPLLTEQFRAADARRRRGRHRHLPRPAPTVEADGATADPRRRRGRRRADAERLPDGHLLRLRAAAARGRRARPAHRRDHHRRARATASLIQTCINAAAGACDIDH